MAQARGVAVTMTFEARDCNLPFELPGQDIIIVNQFFHHVTELETFCQSLRRSLATHGALLSSDIVGRKPMILVSCLGLAVVTAALPYVVVERWTAYPLYIAIMGMFSLRMAPLQSLLTALVPGRQRGALLLPHAKRPRWTVAQR